MADDVKTPNNTTLSSEASSSAPAADPFLDLTATREALSESLKAEPFWGDSQRSWDTVILAGVPLPGIAWVDGKIARRKDRKNIVGKNGHKSTDTGHKASEIVIKLELWTADHWEAFRSLAPRIRPRENQGPPKPVDVQHPSLSVYGIKSVEIDEASLPKPKSDGGSVDIYVVELRCTEWIASPKGQVNTPKASAGKLHGNVIFEDKAKKAPAGSKLSSQPGDQLSSHAASTP